MKVKIDIFTGFLGAGKTSLINEMLGSPFLQHEKILVIQCEAGRESICPDLLKGGKVRVEKLEQGTVLTAEMIRERLLQFFPDRVIIEQNGMAGLDNLLSQFNQPGLQKRCRINSVLHVADARSWEMLVQNMGPRLLEQIAGSELVLLNYSAGLSPERIKTLKRRIRGMNPTCEVLTIATPREFRRKLDEGTLYLEEKPVPPLRWSNWFWGVLLLGGLGYFLFHILQTSGGNFSGLDMVRIQAFNTVFISILMQAFPFLLIGAFLSSLIQVFVPGDAMARFFSRNKITSFLMAILAGVFFPVCDCAIIPVVVRLIKKGVPLPAALTFLLAAPTVNPIVVASTYYAFPDEPMVVAARLILGIAIAVTVGWAFLFYPRRQDLVLDRADHYRCDCIYCRDDSIKGKGFFAKVPVIFRHAGAEFIDVGRFLIMGAFLTALVQTLVSREALFQLAGDREVSLAVMMGAAFVLSVCSTSDAFIGRSFSVAFPVDAVMGFLVLGPMLDLKNLLVLLGSFRKGFVLRLVLFVMGLSYILLYFLTPLIFSR
ncbi:permease [Candidatus Formimonas warabiya]|uniref:CobW/HypB/UreG nucleotide-binding domain-containing protein n=1 Tax=Formimonas warabiya TaxID=1761012 RepID=A0A3G1KZ95_FORW1|nr:permease [Candidatus Formimonas warabiya]ATW27545.1 hypothetical protein DCMF_24805 [Candidatus Formimonas warabiya]